MDADALPPDERLLLRYDTVGAMLDLSERSVERLVALGVFTRIPVLGSVRILRSEVVDYVARLAAEAKTKTARAAERAADAAEADGKLDDDERAS